VETPFWKFPACGSHWRTNSAVGVELGVASVDAAHEGSGSVLTENKGMGRSFRRGALLSAGRRHGENVGTTVRCEARLWGWLDGRELWVG
jgi:hypothetical protein